MQDPTGRLYRVKPDGRIDCLVDTLPSPNGVALDPSGEVVYVAVTRQNAIWRVPILRDGTAAKVGVFLQLSGGTGPDGIAVDEEGGLVVAHVGMGAVWLFNRKGEPRLRIDSPAGTITTNVAFGGPDRKSLFVTEAEIGSILRASVPVAGLKLL